jgi:actin-like ATPase involved in cell morphogenesis
MFGRILGLLSANMAIDLGTANTKEETPPRYN